MKLIILFTLFILNFTAMARSDPFNKQADTTQITDSKLTLHCHQDKPSLAEQTPFEQIKFVGLIVHNHQPTILFITPQDQIYQAQIGDFISQQHLQLTNIFSQQFEFSHWLPNRACQQANSIIIHF